MNQGTRQDLVFNSVILVPLVVLVGILIYLPAFDSLLTSFTNENLRILRPPKFIWLNNYSKLIENSEFWIVTGRSLLVVALTLPLELLISLGLALLLTEAFPGRAMVRTLIILPWMLPPIVNGFLWGWLLNGEYGALNGLLYQLGFIDEYVTWLKNPDTQVLWVTVVQTWTRFAFPTIILLAGLQSIPMDLLDAAKVDGAGAISEFFNVTLPNLRGEIIVALIFTVTLALRNFDLIYITTGGGPGTSTMIPSMFIYKKAFQMGQVGSASSLGIMLTLMIFTLVSLILIIFRERK